LPSSAMPENSLMYIDHPLIWPKTVEFRLYQKRIADAASEKNTLVVLPTALGKTVISALVAADILLNYRNTRVLVMAPTRPLVMQHRESFTRMLKLREDGLALLTGKTPAEYRRAVWDGSPRIVFATPQVVRNDLLEGRLSLKDFGLLVFDECHRAVKEYAYTEVAKTYVSESIYPLILGMTASPGSDPKRVEEVCQALYIEHVECRSEEDPDVKPYIHPIEVEWRRVDLPREYLDVRDRLRQLLNQRLEWLRRQGILRGRTEYIGRRDLVEAGEELRYRLEESIEEERGPLYVAIINQSIALTLFHALELLETQGIHTLKAFLDRVEKERSEKRSYAILTNDPQYEGLKKMVDASSSLEHPKVHLLKQSVGEQLEGKPSSRMIVFTQYRDTASHLVDQLNTVRGVRAERFVGQASRLDDKGLTQEEQARIIKDLEEGTINVLVATSIAEEGLDIPSVDQVIFYEPIPSEIRYIQRRGRTGRKRPGKAVILAANNTYDMIYLYASRRRVEKMRAIAETLNKKLKTIVRKHEKPTPNPLTGEEIRLIEAEAKPTRLEPMLVEDEAERVREFSRKVEKAFRSLYLKLLERGPTGIGVENLTSEMEVEGIPQAAVKAAIERLVKEGQASTLGLNQIVLTTPGGVQGRTYEITIEKILPGEAVVWVNNKWRARLAAEDYNGPRQIIRKGSTFNAVGELYRMDGVLCLRVKHVTQTIT